MNKLSVWLGLIASVIAIVGFAYSIYSWMGVRAAEESRKQDLLTVERVNNLKFRYGYSVASQDIRSTVILPDKFALTSFGMSARDVYGFYADLYKCVVTEECTWNVASRLCGESLDLYHRTNSIYESAGISAKKTRNRWLKYINLCQMSH